MKSTILLCLSLTARSIDNLFAHAAMCTLLGVREHFFSMVYFRGGFSFLSIAVFISAENSIMRKFGAGMQTEPISQEDSPQACQRADLGEAFS